MEQCVALEDRFTILNVFHNSYNLSDWKKDVALLRSSIDGDTGYLKYAAAYFPRLYTNIHFNITDDLVKIVSNGAGNLPPDLAALKSVNNVYYNLAHSAIYDIEM